MRFMSFQSFKWLKWIFFSLNVLLPFTQPDLPMSICWMPAYYAPTHCMCACVTDLYCINEWYLSSVTNFSITCLELFIVLKWYFYVLPSQTVYKFKIGLLFHLSKISNTEITFLEQFCIGMKNLSVNLKDSFRLWQV